MILGIVDILISTGLIALFLVIVGITKPYDR